MAGEVRAEELLVEIYRQKSELLDAGERPDRVVLSMAHYRLIQEYHARLGEAPATGIEYIGRYEIFGLEVMVGDAAPRVERGAGPGADAAGGREPGDA